MPHTRPVPLEKKILLVYPLIPLPAVDFKLDLFCWHKDIFVRAVHIKAGLMFTLKTQKLLNECYCVQVKDKNQETDAKSDHDSQSQVMERKQRDIFSWSAPSHRLISSTESLQHAKNAWMMLLIENKCLEKWDSFQVKWMKAEKGQIQWGGVLIETAACECKVCWVDMLHPIGFVLSGPSQQHAISWDWPITPTDWYWMRLRVFHSSHHNIFCACSGVVYSMLSQLTGFVGTYKPSGVHTCARPCSQEKTWYVWRSTLHSTVDPTAYLGLDPSRVHEPFFASDTT